MEGELTGASGHRLRELPREERPRERLQRLGAAALSDSELIAILLRTGVVGTNAIALATQLLHRYGTLQQLSRASFKEIASIKGIGPAKATQLLAAFGLGQRLARETVSRQRIDTPELVYELLGAEMRSLPLERLRVILLDTRYHLIRVEEISTGTLNESIAHPRDIFRPAIAWNAYAFILVHNHPSGDPAPSDADRRLTMRLAEAANLLQLRMLDHVIIGAPADSAAPFFSFRGAGIL